MDDATRSYVKSLLDPANHMCAIPDGVQQPHVLKRVFVNETIVFATGYGSIIFYPGAHEQRVGTYLEYAADDTLDAVVTKQITTSENLGDNYDLIKLCAGQIRCVASTQATTTAVLAGNCSAAIANSPIVDLNRTITNPVTEMPAAAISYGPLPSITNNAYEVVPRCGVSDTVTFNILPRTIGMPPIRDEDVVPYSEASTATVQRSNQSGTQNSVVAHLQWQSTTGLNFVNDLYVESPKFNVTTNSGRLHTTMTLSTTTFPQIDIVNSPEWTAGDALGLKVTVVGRWYGLDNKIGGQIIKNAGSIIYTTAGGIAPYFNPHYPLENNGTVTIDFDFDVGATITKIDMRYELVPYIRESGNVPTNLPMTGEFDLAAPFSVQISWEVTMPSRNYPGFDDQNFILSVSSAVPGTVYAVSGELVYMATPNTNLLKQVRTTMSGVTFSQYLQVQQLIRDMVHGYGWRLVSVADQMRPLLMYKSFHNDFDDVDEYDGGDEAFNERNNAVVAYGTTAPFISRLKHVAKSASKPFNAVKKEFKNVMVPALKKLGEQKARQFMTSMLEQAPLELLPAIASGGIASGGIAAPSITSKVIGSLTEATKLGQSLMHSKSLAKKFLRVLNKYYPLIAEDPEVKSILKDPMVISLIKSLRTQLPMLMAVSLKQKQAAKVQPKPDEREQFEHLRDEMHGEDVVAVEYDGAGCIVPYVVEDLLSELLGQVDTSGVTYLSTDRRLMHPEENKCELYGTHNGPHLESSEALNVKPKAPMKLFTLVKIDYTHKKTVLYLTPCRRPISGRSVEAGIALLNNAVLTKRAMSLSAISGCVDHSSGVMKIMPLPANVAQPKQAAISAVANGLPVITMMNSPCYLPQGQLVYVQVSTVAEAVDHVVAKKGKKKFKPITFSCEGKWCANNAANVNKFVRKGSLASGPRVSLAVAVEQGLVKLKQEDSDGIESFWVNLPKDEPVFKGEICRFQKLNKEKFDPPAHGRMSSGVKPRTIDEIISGTIVTDSVGGMWVPDGYGEVARAAPNIKTFNKIDKQSDYTMAKYMSLLEDSLDTYDIYKRLQLKTIKSHWPVAYDEIISQAKPEVFHEIKPFPAIVTKGDKDYEHVCELIDKVYDMLKPGDYLEDGYIIFRKELVRIGEEGGYPFGPYEGKHMLHVEKLKPIYLGNVNVGFVLKTEDNMKDDKLKKALKKYGLTYNKVSEIASGASPEEVFTDDLIASVNNLKKKRTTPKGPGGEQKPQKQGGKRQKKQQAGDFIPDEKLKQIATLLGKDLKSQKSEVLKQAKAFKALLDE